MITSNAFWTELKRLGITPEHKILLALSGGMDSVVLFHLLLEARVPFSAAHVNYGLRGEDSVQDEIFCRELCTTHNIDCFIYDAKAEMERREDISLQEAARNIRYRFFDELIQERQFQYILTAHHANDSVETFFVNALRGSGAKGLKGIPEKNGKSVRPILTFSKADVEAYAKQHTLSFRDDLSNFKDDYLRNRIRHHVIPALEKADENAIQRLKETMANLSAEADLLAYFLQQQFPEPIKATEIVSITSFPSALWATLIFKRFQAIGLNASQAEDIASVLNQSGKQFQTPSHRLLIDRKCIYAQEITDLTSQEIVLSSWYGQLPGYQIVLKSPNEIDISEKNSNLAYLDADAIRLPLVWRSLKTGDSMIPLGMKGRKKISDILVDTKKTRFEKESLHVLCSEGEIVWLEGFRINDSSKITAQTSRVLCIIPEKLQP